MLLIVPPAVLATMCSLCQLAWSRQRVSIQRSFPLLMPFVTIWIFAVVLAVLATIGLPDAFVAKLSLVPEMELKANDGWMILLGWATLFTIFYGAGSICVSGGLFWMRQRKTMRTTD